MIADTRSARNPYHAPNEEFVQHLCVDSKTSTRKCGVMDKTCLVSHPGKSCIERINNP